MFMAGMERNLIHMFLIMDMLETNDWLWVMSTIDGNLVLDGKGGIGIEVE